MLVNDSSLSFVYLLADVHSREVLVWNFKKTILLSLACYWRGTLCIYKMLELCSSLLFEAV